MTAEGRRWFVLLFDGRRSRKAHSFAIANDLPGAGEARTACDLRPYQHVASALDVLFAADDGAPRCDDCRVTLGEALAVAA